MRTLLKSMMWLAMVGCTTDEAEPELATEESELVFGTGSSRQEIGRISSSLGTCTATLISPRAILTAAHCVGPTATNLTAVPNGATFFFTDRNGAARFAMIDRVHAFNYRGWVPIGDVTGYGPIADGSPLLTDVAIAHLSTAVPAQQAIPATIATRRPPNGTIATTFGFGCVDRVFGGGVGTQRSFTFAVGNTTTSLCAGDDGGPVVFGNATGGGAVWGVNQGAPLLIDVFSDVTSYAKQIEAVLRSWDGLDEPDMDRFGADYFVEIANDVTTCRRGCERDAKCRAFSYRAADRHCWRKHGASDPTPAAGITSGLPARFESQTDRLGGDFLALAIGQPDLCAAACTRTDNCLAWTTFNGTCFLKNTIPPPTPCPGCTSGVTARGLEPDIDRPGSDIATHWASSSKQCATLCANDRDCLAFTHLGLSCFLKGSVPAAVPVSPGQFMTSGVVRGVEPETDRPGGDYVTLALDPVPRACQAACATQARCKAWTYTPAGLYGNCVLKEAAGPAVRSVTATSGLKGAEFLPAL